MSSLTSAGSRDDYASYWESQYPKGSPLTAGDRISSSSGRNVEDGFRSERFVHVSREASGSPRHRNAVRSKGRTVSSNAKYSKASFSQRRRCTRQHFQFLAIFVLLVLTGVVENVTYSVNGKLYMRQYRCMLNILVVLACTFFFFCIVQWQRFSGRNSCLRKRRKGASFDGVDEDEDEEMMESAQLMLTLQTGPWWKSRRRMSYFLAMAFCDCLALYMGLLASNSVSAELRLVLQQLSIPTSMLVSYRFLNRRFLWVHIFGAATICVGVLFCLMNIILETPDQSSKPLMSAFFALSCIPLALGGCLKEWVLTHPTMPQSMNLVNLYVAFFQLCFGVLLLPVGLSIQNLDRGIHDPAVPLDKIPQNFLNGMKCGLLGIDAPSSVAPYDQNCQDAQLSTWVYMACVCCFNMLMLWIIKNGTVVLYFIANALAIPLIAVISTTNLYEFLGLGKDVFTAWQIVGLLVVVAGTALYRSLPEQVRHPEDDEFYYDSDYGESGYAYMSGDDDAISASDFYNSRTRSEDEAITQLSKN